MKNRTLFRVLCTVFGFITLLSILVMVLIRPKPYTDITRDFTYTGSNELSLPQDMPETVEQDGETYTRVIEGEGAPNITVIDSDATYTETVTIENLPSKQAPETRQFTIGGKEYTLTLVSADYVENNRDYTATGELRYEDTYSQPTPPETSPVTYVNDMGDTITVEGSLVSVERVSGGESTVQNTTIRSTVELPEGSNVFIVNGSKLVTYDPYTPTWDGYQADVLVGAGLSANAYKVLGGEWAGAPYYSGSTFYRDIVWTVQTYGSSSSTWVAKYQAVGSGSVYTASAVYSANVADIGLDQTYANGGTYNLSATITYRLNKVVSGNPIVELISGNKLLLPVIAVVGGIGFLFSLFGLVFLAKTKSSKWEHDEEDDEEEYEDEEY